MVPQTNYTSKAETEFSNEKATVLLSAGTEEGLSVGRQTEGDSETESHLSQQCSQ